MEAFRVFRETLPQPDEQTVAANGGVYGDAQVNAMLKATHNNIIDQIFIAFLVHFLPPNLLSKVQEKKPASMRDCVENAAEHQRIILNQNQPMGSNPQPRILAVEGTDDPYLEDVIINVLQKHFNKKGHQGNSNPANKGKGKGKGNQSGQNQSGNLPPLNKYPYCNKFGHGAYTCYAWQNDNTPCYNTKDEPFCPKGESSGFSTGPNSFKYMAPFVSTSPKDFPHWV